MVYIEPETVMRRFSSYLREDVRDALDDDRGSVDAQLGSLSSSLYFLSREQSSYVASIAKQRDGLHDRLSAVEDVLADFESAAGDEPAPANDDIETVRAAVAAARDRLREQDELLAASEVEMVLIEATNDVLEAIDTAFGDDAARRARAPLYAFLETRHTSQVVALGGDPDR